MIDIFMFFEPNIVLYLCNKNQQNARILRGLEL